MYVFGLGRRKRRGLGLGLGFTNPVGTGGVLDVCVCLGCGGVVLCYVQPKYMII